jgi:altronate dehydratase large subunit
MKMLYGYIRENGKIGFRNHVLVLPTVICAANTARKIAECTGASIAFNTHGCGHIGEDYFIAKRTLEGIGKNPNVAAVLVVALGCEKINGVELANEISKSGKPVELLSIQKDGGTSAVIEKGCSIVKLLYEKVKDCQRVPVW